MKKILLIIVMLLLVSGCGKKNEEVRNNTNNDGMMVEIDGEKFKLRSSSSLKDMHYKENYVDFYSDAIGNVRTMSYTKNGEFKFEVRLMYEDKHSFDEVKEMVSHPSSLKQYGDITYTYFDYKGDNNEDIHLYLYSYNDVTYTIMFIAKTNINDLENKFMNSIKFGEI